MPRRLDTRSAAGLNHWSVGVRGLEPLIAWVAATHLSRRKPL